MSLPSKTACSGTTTAAWSSVYAKRHKPERLRTFPAGISAPRRVRIYQRSEHYLLQWWDKGQKRTISERVDGDLLSALARSRQIDERLENFRSAGVGKTRRPPEQLLTDYLLYLQRRADAGEIDPTSVHRYQSALQHFAAFIQLPEISHTYRYSGQIDRDFQLQFAGYLNDLKVLPNGKHAGTTRPMRGQRFVLDTVRSMIGWAADPDRGNLLPEGFRNPFLGPRSCRRMASDPLDGPDITTAMAVELVGIADAFQMAILAPLMLCGLRPGELGWLFAEHMQDGWLRVPNIPELDYTTKGRRDKRFPVFDRLPNLRLPSIQAPAGLLYRNRRAQRRNPKLVMLGQPLSAMVQEYGRRCAATGASGSSSRRAVRDRLLQDAGQLTYDDVEGEFQKLARQLNWPRSATLKDLRHLFATCLENAGVPQFYRQYLMGHSPGRAPIATYTHLTEDMIQKHFELALSSDLSPMVEAICQRMAKLSAVAPC